MDTIDNTLQSIYNTIKELPSGDENAYEKAIARDKRLTKPAGSLGALEDISSLLAKWQGKEKISCDNPITLVFAGNHGICKHNISAFPQVVTKQMVENFKTGGACVNQLCKVAGSGLNVYDMNLDNPTKDFSIDAAMSEQECTNAIAFGMNAVDGTNDIIAVGEMGIGNTTAAAALCYSLFGEKAQSWVGNGTGIDKDQLDNKIKLINNSVNKHIKKISSPLENLMYFGGFELCAIVGVIIAARMSRSVVLLDGYTTTAAASVLYEIDETLLDHCIISHLSEEPGHRLLLDKINKRAILNLNMRLGEASGSTLCINIIKSCCEYHNNMASFDEANVTNKS